MRSMKIGTREWIHRGAVVCFHICLLAEMLILLTERYSWEPYGAGWLTVVFGRLQLPVHGLLTVLLAEKLLRKGKGALPGILLAGAAWAVGDPDLLGACLLFVLSDLAEERKTLRTMLWFYAAAFLLTVLLHWTGNLQDRLKVFKYGTGHMLGFAHSNVGGGLLLGVDLAVWMLYLKKHRGWTLLLFWGTAAVSYLVFMCRTGAVLMAVFPLLAWGMERLAAGRAARWMKTGVRLLPICCLLLTAGLICTYVYRLVDWKSIGLPNEMLLRFKYPANTLLKSGISWVRPEVLPNRYPIDNEYAYFLLYGGVAGCAVLTVMMTWAAGIAAGGNRTDLMAVMALVTVYGLMERAFTSVLFCFLPVVLLDAGQKEPDVSPGRTRWLSLSLRGKAAASLCAAVLCMIGGFALPERNELPEKVEQGSISRNAAGEVLGAETDERQTFRAEGPFTGIQVLTATYTGIPWGTIQAELTDEAGEMLEQMELPAWNANDISFLSVPLSREYPAGTYGLRMGETRLTIGAVSLWRDEEDPYPEGALYLKGKETSADWSFRLYRGGISGRRILQRDLLVLWGMLATGIWMVPDLKRRKEHEGKS